MVLDNNLPNLNYANQYLQKTAANQTFSADVLLTDEWVCLMSIILTCEVLTAIMTQQYKIYVENEESS